MRRRPTRETVAVDPFSPHAVRAAYDVAAEDYEAAFGDDLDHLPLDRAMLEAATDTVAGGGIALDLGCGTGVAGVPRRPSWGADHRRRPLGRDAGCGPGPAPVASGGG